MFYISSDTFSDYIICITEISKRLLMRYDNYEHIIAFYCYILQLSYLTSVIVMPSYLLKTEFWIRINKLLEELAKNISLQSSKHFALQGLSSDALTSFRQFIIFTAYA